MTAFIICLALLPIAVAGKATINDVIAGLEASNSTLLQYPTQLTQNIMPKQIHSHNDCEVLGLISEKRCIIDIC